jgi:hypothetical protein
MLAGSEHGRTIPLAETDPGVTVAHVTVLFGPPARAPSARKARNSARQVDRGDPLHLGGSRRDAATGMVAIGLPGQADGLRDG